MGVGLVNTNLVWSFYENTIGFQSIQRLTENNAFVAEACLLFRGKTV